MRTSSLEQLKGQISTGQYTIDSRELADDIVAKFTLIGRVGRLLTRDEGGPAREAGRAPQHTGRRGARSASERPLQARRQRLF